MSKKIVKSLLVASVLSASAGANATEIMFGFVGSATYHSQGEEIAAMVASMDGFNVTQRDLDSAVYNDLDSFDQVWVYDLSRVADNNAFQVQNYANISSWYNNRDQSAQNLIADGRIISSSSTYTSRLGMPAETAWIQNYATQLDAFGGGLMLGTDDSGYVLGINEINAQIGIDPFSGLYEDDPKLAIVDTESRFYIADVELCSDITLIGSVANTALSLFDELTHYRNLGSLKAISALKKDNVRLTKQNKSLSNKIKAAKKKVAVRKNKVLKKSLVRANRKIATAGAALIPVSGTVVVGAAMALEIHELCKDSKDMAAFEKDLFGEGADFVLDEETESGPDETKLCGMDVDVQIEEVQNRVASSYQSLKDKTVTTFLEGAESIRQWEASLLADTEDNLSDIFEELRRALAFQYQSGSDSFIEPNTTPYEGFSQKGTIIRLNND